RAGYRLEPDAEQRAAAFRRKLEHAVVLRQFRGDARLPLDVASLERTHNLLRPLGRTEKVGVVDRDDARAAILHFMDHFVDRPVTEPEPVHQRLRAERAALVASARGLHERLVDIAVLLEKVV